MSRRAIVEIPLEVCEKPDIREITLAIKTQILEEKLTLKEVFAVRTMFPVFDAKASYREGDIVCDGLTLKKMTKDKFEDVVVKEEPLVDVKA
jgi:hypothetical protein